MLHLYASEGFIDHNLNIYNLSQSNKLYLKLANRAGSVEILIIFSESKCITANKPFDTAALSIFEEIDFCGFSKIHSFKEKQI